MKTAVKHAKENEKQSEVVKKASASKKRPKGEWFLECEPFANQRVMEMLAEHNLGDAECKFSGIRDKTGKVRNLIRIPSYFVRIFRNAAVKVDPRFKLQILKRNGPEGEFYSAGFVENKNEGKKMLEMKKGLKAQIARKKKEAAKTNK